MTTATILTVAVLMATAAEMRSKPVIASSGRLDEMLGVRPMSRESIHWRSTNR